MKSLIFTVVTSCLSLIFCTGKFVMSVTKPTLKMEEKKINKKFKGKVYFKLYFYIWKYENNGFFLRNIFEKQAFQNTDSQHLKELFKCPS